MTVRGHEKTYNFWGWGWAEDAVTPAETPLLDGIIGYLNGASGADAVTTPEVAEFDVRPPRIAAPTALQPILTDAPAERLRHAYGQSYAAGVRMLMRDVPAPPDWVAYPETEDQIDALMNWASGARIALIPWGGGSSVCAGVDADIAGHDAVVSLDLEKLGRVLEVDEVSRAARIEGGAFGPDIEAALRPKGLTLRHFPQSFEFSTLGGWIATRSGGHYATLYTHIDDLVESVRMLTPAGPWESRRLPGSGAGPSPDRMIIGSEGAYGVITEAWMRVQERPTFRASVSVTFGDTMQAANAVRALAQSGLYPTNCRLLDKREAFANQVGDGTKAIVVLGFESADHPLDAWVARALELARDHGGVYDEKAVARSLSGGDEHREGAAGKWRNAFLRMPYLRDYLQRHGVIVDTFESAITWDRFPDFYKSVIRQTREAIRRITGFDASVSCRFTHVYPDGPAPYFSYFAPGASTGDLASALAKWREIKAATNEICVANGGTVTHHHAVGRDHRSGFEAQTPRLYQSAIRAVKKVADPAGIMNPGVLIDP